MKEFCSNIKIKTVPFIQICLKLPEKFDNSLDAWLERARGKYTGTQMDREGIVVRTIEPISSENMRGNRISFKVLNNDFLLKER
jgi:hypothetical protein